MNLPPSIHHMLRHTVATIKKPSDTFLLQKIDGQYRSFSYEQILERMNAVSAFLVENQYRKGDRLAMVMENCPEYLVFDQSLMQIGCINTSIYPTLPEADIEYIIKDSGSRGVIVGNPFLLKKLMKIIDNCPAVQHIFINFDPAKAIKDHRIISLEEVFSKGKELYPKNRDEIEKQLASIEHDDLASLIYTSGTTGIPKGVMLSHKNFLSNVWMANQLVPEVGKNDRYLSFLPLCHVYERLATYYLATFVGAEIAFAQSIETIAANLVEAKPTVMTTVPRLLERTKDKIIKNAEAKGKTSFAIFNWALGVGEKVRKKKENDSYINPILAAQYALADKLVFSTIKSRLGGNMRLMVSGGAALPQHIGEFYGNIGIKAMEGYGLTETSPLIAVNLYKRQIYGTVGMLSPGLEVGIIDEKDGSFITIQTNESFDENFGSDAGEIVVRGPSVMRGYWNKPDDTAAVMDKDGWFHTGDVGRFYQGHLKITDRIKNMLVNSFGKNIYPTPVENVYLKSPKIDQVFLVGDKREYITAIIVPPKEEIKEAFGKTDDFFSIDNDFIEEENIRKWIADDIKKFSSELAKFERIKNFIVKRNPFSVELGEITPTLKTKRKVLEKKYAAEIETMYEKGEEAED